MGIEHSVRALIQGRWYMHVLSILAITSIGMCTNYVQPLQVHRYVQVPASKQPLLVCAHTSRTDLLYCYSYELWYVHGPCFTPPPHCVPHRS